MGGDDGAKFQCIHSLSFRPQDYTPYLSETRLDAEARRYMGCDRVKKRWVVFLVEVCPSCCGIGKISSKRDCWGNLEYIKHWERLNYNSLGNCGGVLASQINAMHDVTVCRGSETLDKLESQFAVVISG